MPARGYSLDQWRLVRKIGEGDQGKSTLMERMSDSKLAVRKRINFYELMNSNDKPLEATILQDVLPSSRRIIKLHTFSFEPSRHDNDYLIEWFEYCRGGDLQHAVRHSERLPEDFIWHCFIQIAEALAILHKAGSQTVVHRDVKPDNIFLEAKYRYEAPWPNLKLGDFGMAMLKERTTGVFIPCWQGPEIPLLTPAGDVWGLGAIIHWMGHGCPPIGPRPRDFQGSQLDWEARPEARKPIELSNSYSDHLSDYMMACLEINPNDRPSSAELVEHLKRSRPRPRRHYR